MGGRGGDDASTVAVPEGVTGRLLTELGKHALSADELAPRAGISVREALARLTDMELLGLVRQVPGMRFKRVA